MLKLVQEALEDQQKAKTELARRLADHRRELTAQIMAERSPTPAQ